MNRFSSGYLEDWERIGIGIKPIDQQVLAISDRGVERLQFDFNHGYGDAPDDMAILVEFPAAQAIQCDAHYSESSFLNGLEGLKSFHDHVYNRSGVDWAGLSQVQDLGLYDYHGKSHPDYSIFEDLRALDVSNLPSKYSHAADLPISKLRTLSLTRTKFQSFEGFENLNKLQALNLISCREFTALNLVANLPELKFLSIFACRKVTSLEFIHYLPKLEVLSFERLGDIQSWEPLRDHSTLKRIEVADLKGAKAPKELLETVPTLEFVSHSIIGS